MPETAATRTFPKQGAGAVFDDGVTQIMGHAFDSACKDLRATGQPAIVYEVIANRIINAAMNGERDVDLLRKTALAGLDLGSAAANGQVRPLNLLRSTLALGKPVDNFDCGGLQVGRSRRRRGVSNRSH